MLEAGTKAAMALLACANLCRESKPQAGGKKRDLWRSRPTSRRQELVKRPRLTDLPLEPGVSAMVVLFGQPRAEKPKLVPSGYVLRQCSSPSGPWSNAANHRSQFCFIGAECPVIIIMIFSFVVQSVVLSRISFSFSASRKSCSTIILTSDLNEVALFQPKASLTFVQSP